jgi:hypothetical protein
MNDETLPLYKKKAPKKGGEKETRGLDQSPGKQTAQKTGGHKEVKEPLSTETSISCLKPIRKGR